MAELTLDEELHARFAELPKVVQEAITSAEVEQHLRTLATTHKLHLDQWQLLENQVILALLGALPVQELPERIAHSIGVDGELASAIAKDISNVVFEPIRQELERQLEHPEAHEKQLSGVETFREQALGGEQVQETGASMNPSPTPPAPKAETTVARTPASGAYKPGEASTTRRSVVDDPYRELPQ